jgi:quercetin dioxygenase-like cupin family protein
LERRGTTLQQGQLDRHVRSSFPPILWKQKEPDDPEAKGQRAAEERLEILPKQPSTTGPAERFTGDVWIDVIASGEAPSRVRVNVVRFAPGARNAWHAHAVGQTLHVAEGVGLIQSRGGEVVEIRPGQTIHTPPGEWHWHGAAPDHFMSHLAIWERPDEGPETQWGEHVTDDEYHNR